MNVLLVRLEEGGIANGTSTLRKGAVGLIQYEGQARSDVASIFRNPASHARDRTGAGFAQDWQHKVLL